MATHFRVISHPDGPQLLVDSASFVHRGRFLIPRGFVYVAASHGLVLSLHYPGAAEALPMLSFNVKGEVTALRTDYQHFHLQEDITWVVLGSMGLMAPKATSRKNMLVYHREPPVYEVVHMENDVEYPRDAGNDPIRFEGSCLYVRRTDLYKGCPKCSSNLEGKTHHRCLG